MADTMTVSGAPHDTPISQPSPGPQNHHNNQSTPSHHARTPPQQSQQSFPPPPPQQQSQQQSQQQQQQQQLLQQQQSRSVKRPRPVKSCTECRKRKLRCDRLCPCSQCQKSTRICRYAAENESSNLSDVSDGEGIEPSRAIKRHCPPGSLAASGTAASDVSFPPVAKNGEQTGIHLLEELSMRMDRLEKQVLVRSPAATDMYGARMAVASPDTIRGLTVKPGMLRTRFFGQNSSRVMLNLFKEAKNFSLNHQSIAGAREVLLGFHQLHKTLHDSYQKSLAPITVFVDSMMPVLKRMTDILPPKAVCDRLLGAYIDTSESLYRTLHIPSFTEQYNLYWENNLQHESFVPQLLSVLAIASRFGTKSKGLGHERSEGIHIPTACALVRSWLDGLKGKQLADFTTLQVEVLLLYAQRMITPRSEDSWTQLGYVVRLAMNMGLHRDPSEADHRISVFIGELRRRLWYTLVDMDLHLSLNCNMPCIIREGDFTCRPPRNLDDVDLYPEMNELPQSKLIDQMTDSQTQVYAAMTLGHRLRVAHLVHRIDSIRDYQEVLDIGSKLDRFLDDINYIFPRHGTLSDSQKSKVWRLRVLLDMHVRRPLLTLYRPLAIGVREPHEQIARTYLRSSMVILKYLDEIDPLLSHFQEIKDMYHLVLKRDIIQAAFSVCYYIRSAVRSGAGHGTAHAAYAFSPEPSADETSFPLETATLWSPARLIGTVEKTLDLLIRNASGSDIKDIVCLTTVLESVRSADVKEDDITNGLRGTLDRCLRASNMGPDTVAHQSQGPLPVDPFQMDRYGHGRMPMPYQGNTMGNRGSFDLDGWILWDGWD
ncbi:hypothetical protein S7711_10217 [Stachybotrys chartarum IBT 7711]|uniref:Zn(2)-C6 fungal-type domain-containing protein n=1 Tax=Stachybotrys chartarum (strain CBS 109288 / IBT 7711) TaxID=1280523 RepID=A0A084AF28_STACB|nr:hypothetical protein S7711_10217 [Stachybotrys chartarum IBT 7711]